MSSNSNLRFVLSVWYTACHHYVKVYNIYDYVIDIIHLHLDRDWKRARRPIELHYVWLALCRLRSHGRCWKSSLCYWRLRRVWHPCDGFFSIVLAWQAIVIVLERSSCPRADPEIFFGGVNLFICVWSKGHFYINLIGWNGILQSLGGVHWPPGPPSGSAPVNVYKSCVCVQCSLRYEYLSWRKGWANELDTASKVRAYNEVVHCRVQKKRLSSLSS